MALYYTLPVYRDTYRMILQTFRLTREFPREYKYSLGQDLRRDSMQLVRHIYRANVASGNFWSSTENSNNTSNAWRVNFSNGNTNNNDKGNNNYVRCVRQCRAAEATRNFFE